MNGPPAIFALACQHPRHRLPLDLLKLLKEFLVDVVELVQVELGLSAAEAKEFLDLGHRNIIKSLLWVKRLSGDLGEPWVSPLHYLESDEYGNSDIDWRMYYTDHPRDAALNAFRTEEQQRQYELEADQDAWLLSQ